MSKIPEMSTGISKEEVCAKNWQSFVIQQDTMTLFLKYKQPYTLESGNNKLTITVEDISDNCSEESRLVTYICESFIKLKIKLNNDCEYVTKYPIRSSRYTYKYDRPDLFKKKFDCKSLENEAIINIEGSNNLFFYHTIFRLWELIPYTKTDKELLEISQNKEKYTVDIFLQKRCY